VPQLSVQFQDTPIQVLPREEQRVTVKVTPAGAHTVRFALLASEGDSTPVDAALDRSEVISDASGLASVVLTAPSAAIDFLLRAQVGMVSATTSVSVVPGVLISLDVHPNYTSKRRDRVREWIASVHVGVGCDDFPDGVVADSQLLVRRASNAPLRLEDIPAADKLAVTLRADALARGCTTVLQPAPGADTEVVVTVTDQPIDLTRTTLQVLLGVSAKDTSFTAELDAALEAIETALLNGAPNDLVALLDAMQASLKAGNASKFAVARDEASWDESLLGPMRRGVDTRLRDAIVRYSQIGRAPLFSPQAFEGLLKADASSEAPSLELERVGGIAADEAGVSATGSSWSVDSSDTVAFAATLNWKPSALLAALSIAPASAETGAVDVPGALADLFSCADLANSLADGVPDAVNALIAVCPVTCLETTCEAALVRMWDRARLASEDSGTTMSVLATGAALVGSERQATQLDGSWVGRLTRGRDVSQSGGGLKGYEPR
jgi:hypothetical protein